MGASVDIFGKATVLKQADLKTAEWNKFYASFLTEVSYTFCAQATSALSLSLTSFFPACPR